MAKQEYKYSDFPLSVCKEMILHYVFLLMTSTKFLVRKKWEFIGVLFDFLNQRSNYKMVWILFIVKSNWTLKEQYYAFNNVVQCYIKYSYNEVPGNPDTCWKNNCKIKYFFKIKVINIFFL